MVSSDKKRAKSGYHFFMASLELSGSICERNKQAADAWKGLSVQEKLPWLLKEQAEKKAIAQARADEVDDGLLDASEWEERDSKIVVFQCPPDSNVKPETQRARILANPLLAQHCACCGIILFPVVSLMCCPRCRKSLQKLRWDSKSHVFRVVARSFIEPGALALLPKDDNQAEERYGNEVIMPKQVKTEVQKWKRCGRVASSSPRQP